MRSRHTFVPGKGSLPSELLLALSLNVIDFRVGNEPGTDAEMPQARFVSETTTLEPAA